MRVYDGRVVQPPAATWTAERAQPLRLAASLRRRGARVAPVSATGLTRSLVWSVRNPASGDRRTRRLRRNSHSITVERRNNHKYGHGRRNSRGCWRRSQRTQFPRWTKGRVPWCLV